MTMILWVTALVVVMLIMFALGMLASRLFAGPRPPERRSGHDRRQGTVPPEGVERRGTDRRRKHSMVPGISVLASATALALVGTIAFAETHVESIFAGSQPSLLDSGWAACSTPITWSMDTSRMKPADAVIARRQMQSDFAKWGKASGLTFKYAGEVPVTYDDSKYQVSSTVHPSSRHIYIAFLSDADSTLLDSRTVGFSAPSKVMPGELEIVEGSIVLETEYVKKASRTRTSVLYLHEMGHALGLAHGADKRDVMWPIVDSNNELAPADIAGIRALTKVCKAAA